MDKVLNFLSANYIYFLIGSVVLLLFLIGYIVVEKKNKKKEKYKEGVQGEPPDFIISQEKRFTKEK